MAKPIFDLEGIDINAEFLSTLGLLESDDRSVFITGKAGTGKSTFLKYFRNKTKKKMVVLAPTGVAAVNIQGQTIHSFFNFKPDITVEHVRSLRISAAMCKVYRNLETIMIDEVSMVRADLVDCMDAFLRIYGRSADSPFGGVQMIFIGDMYQLAPVVRQNERDIFQTVYRSPYFFDARVFTQLELRIVEFEKNYRQKDQDFIQLLNHIRANTVEQEHLDTLNAQVNTGYVPAETELTVYLTTTNQLAEEINDNKLQSLTTAVVTWDGDIEGEFDSRDLPTQEHLLLKVGAQVILLNNDSAHRWINGSLGRVVDVFEDNFRRPVVVVKLANGEHVEVETFTWEIFRFSYDEDTSRIVSEVVGRFTQFPLKLAWAVTIHKSQGKTFEKVIIDIGKGTFCHGQLYVALSRCTALSGIILKRPIARRDIFIDQRITLFLNDLRYKHARENLPESEKLKIIEDAILLNQTLEIVYLKEDGVPRTRRIIPRTVKTIIYNGQKGHGVEAYCTERQAHWIFRFPCIVSVRAVMAEECSS